jgi:hypothetical protein
MKAFTRVLIALFGAFFVSLYAQVSVCRPGIPEQPSNQWLCGHRLLPTWLLLIPVFFIALMLLLGKHCVAYRRTMSVLLLSTYGIYAAFESVKLHAWWQVSFSVAMLLAAVGIALRKRWGSVLVCALSLLFVLHLVGRCRRSLRLPENSQTPRSRALICTRHRIRTTCRLLLLRRNPAAQVRTRPGMTAGTKLALGERRRGLLC